MEVILKQDVDKIGKATTVVKVKDGFARNFLIPRGLAIPVTTANLKKIEEEKQRQSVQLEKAKHEAEELKTKLEAVSLTIPVLTNEEDKIYGSISNAEIAEALKEEGFDIDKKIIIVNDPVKTLGIYEAQAKLHPQVEAKIKIWVVKK